ncbi:MAG: pteridine reductase [Gammaproteobacteria bacterium]|nr:pteridine reductase [Gammaproteobacteria bacterium]
MDSTLDSSMNKKVALITGGAKRIGAETARTLHAAGMNIVIHYRSSQQAADELCYELNNARKDSAAVVQADLDDEHVYGTLIEDAVEVWGHLDVLVNNASSFYPTEIGSITLGHWHNLMNSNLKAPMFLSQAATPFLKETRGCIINMVDIHAFRPMKSHPVYCAAKAGLAMLTQSLARELGPEIRVNGIGPGAILWPDNDMSETTKQHIVERTALKRHGEPKDIAKAILFLVRDADYITGHIVPVDGGRSLNI